MDIPAVEFAFFFNKNGIVWGMTLGKEKYALDEKLDLLEIQFSPDDFLRANRQTIVSWVSVVEVSNDFNGRLLMRTNPAPTNGIIVNKGCAPWF